MQNTAKQNYRGLVDFYNTRPGYEVGLFYNAPEPTRSTSKVCKLFATIQKAGEACQIKLNFGTFKMSSCHIEDSLQTIQN